MGIKVKEFFESVNEAAKSLHFVTWILVSILPGGLIAIGIYLLVRKYKSTQQKASDDNRPEHVLDK